MLHSRDTSHTPTDGSLSRTVSFAAPTFAVLRGLVEVQTTPLLGVGAFGSVYYAVLVEGARAVALKAISKERTRAAAQRGGAQQSAQELLYGEAKLLEELAATKHRNMLRFHGWWQDEGFVYVAQQLCMGGELPEWLSRQPAYSETVAAKVMYDLLQALTHCHGLGVVHRDIKPQNLLFSSAAPDAYLKLADWGLAARWRPSDAPLAEFCGTLDFVSPEMLEGAYTATTDVWAAGVLLHLLLCGRNPFRGPSSAATEHRCVPLDAPRCPAGAPRVGRDASPLLGLLAPSSHVPRTFIARSSRHSTLSASLPHGAAPCPSAQPAHTLPLPPSRPYSPSRPCLRACSIRTAASLQLEKNEALQGVSDSARASLRALLEPCVSARPVAKEALRLPWLKMRNAGVEAPMLRAVIPAEIQRLCDQLDHNGGVSPSNSDRSGGSAPDTPASGAEESSDDGEVVAAQLSFEKKGSTGNQLAQIQIMPRREVNSTLAAGASRMLRDALHAVPNALIARRAERPSPSSTRIAAPASDTVVEPAAPMPPPPPLPPPPPPPPPLVSPESVQLRWLQQMEGPAEEDAPSDEYDSPMLKSKVLAGRVAVAAAAALAPAADARGKKPPPLTLTSAQVWTALPQLYDLLGGDKGVLVAKRAKPIAIYHHHLPLAIYQPRQLWVSLEEICLYYAPLAKIARRARWRADGGVARTPPGARTRSLVRSPRALSSCGPSTATAEESWDAPIAHHDAPIASGRGWPAEGGITLPTPFGTPEQTPPSTPGNKAAVGANEAALVRLDLRKCKRIPLSEILSVRLTGEATLVLQCRKRVYSFRFPKAQRATATQLAAVLQPTLLLNDSDAPSSAPATPSSRVSSPVAARPAREQQQGLQQAVGPLSSTAEQRDARAPRSPRSPRSLTGALIGSPRSVAGLDRALPKKAPVELADAPNTAPAGTPAQAPAEAAPAARALRKARPFWELQLERQELKRQQEKEQEEKEQQEPASAAGQPAGPPASAAEEPSALAALAAAVDEQPPMLPQPSPPRLSFPEPPSSPRPEPQSPPRLAFPEPSAVRHKSPGPRSASAVPVPEQPQSPPPRLSLPPDQPTCRPSLQLDSPRSDEKAAVWEVEELLRKARGALSGGAGTRYTAAPRPPALDAMDAPPPTLPHALPHALPPALPPAHSQERSLMPRAGAGATDASAREPPFGPSRPPDLATRAQRDLSEISRPPDLAELTRDVERRLRDPMPRLMTRHSKRGAFELSTVNIHSSSAADDVPPVPPARRRPDARPSHSSITSPSSAAAAAASALAAVQAAAQATSQSPPPPIEPVTLDPAEQWRRRAIEALGAPSRFSSSQAQGAVVAGSRPLSPRTSREEVGEGFAAAAPPLHRSSSSSSGEGSSSQWRWLGDGSSSPRSPSVTNSTAGASTTSVAREMLIDWERVRGDTSQQKSVRDMVRVLSSAISTAGSAPAISTAGSAPAISTAGSAPDGVVRLVPLRRRSFERQEEEPKPEPPSRRRISAEGLSRQISISQSQVDSQSQISISQSQACAAPSAAAGTGEGGQTAAPDETSTSGVTASSSPTLSMLRQRASHTFGSGSSSSIVTVTPQVPGPRAVLGLGPRNDSSLSFDSTSFTSVE